MIEQLLKELNDTWDLSPETLNHIKEVMVGYAISCQMDSRIREEAEYLAEEMSRDS